MRYSTQIKPFTFLADNAERLPEALEEHGDPIILTRDGHARAVLLSVREFERMQEALALYGILDLAEQNIAEGKTRPAREVIEELRDELQVEHAERQAAE